LTATTLQRWESEHRLSGLHRAIKANSRRLVRNSKLGVEPQFNGEFIR
jgi:hypothetical protein